MAIDAVLNEALKLSAEDRAELANRLWDSIREDELAEAGSVAVDPEYEAAWTATIDRRLQEMRDGTVKGIPAEEVFAKMRAKLEARRAR